MAATAMLNVRMDRSLKIEGDSVLARAGTNASDAIRSLYRHMEDSQMVPECCVGGSRALSTEEKRAAMRDLVGIAPLKSGETVESLRAERLADIQ